MSEEPIYTSDRKDISAWSDLNGDYVIIGDEHCQPGDPIIAIPLTQSAILQWIKVLLGMLEDGNICDLPGSIEKCISSEEGE